MRIFLIIAFLLSLGACYGYRHNVSISNNFMQVDFSELQDKKSTEACQSILVTLVPMNSMPSIARMALDAEISNVYYVDRKEFAKGDESGRKDGQCTLGCFYL